MSVYFNKLVLIDENVLLQFNFIILLYEAVYQIKCVVKYFIGKQLRLGQFFQGNPLDS